MGRHFYDFFYDVDSVIVGENPKNARGVAVDGQDPTMALSPNKCPRMDIEPPMSEQNTFGMGGAGSSRHNTGNYSTRVGLDFSSPTVSNV